MALRYSSKNAAVAVAGTTFTHGLGATPDGWHYNHRGVPPSPGAATLYLAAAPSSTTFVLASSSGATTCDVFVFRNHSIIQ